MVMELSPALSRIDTKPSEASGCWFNTGYLLSCEHKWLSVRAGAATSVSEVLINRILTSGGGVSGGDSRTDHTIACVRSLARSPFIYWSSSIIALLLYVKEISDMFLHTGFTTHETAQ